MRKASRMAALGLAVVYLSGCGTSANLSGGAQGWRNAQIYGGVLTDVKSTQQWVTSNWTNFADWQQDVGTIVGVGLISLDVPFSAIGDTLTLPITIPAVLLRDSGPARNGNRGNAVAPPPVSGPAPPPPAVTNIPPDVPAGAAPPPPVGNERGADGSLSPSPANGLLPK
jgi:uncharacterized protein YceK